LVSAIVELLGKLLAAGKALPGLRRDQKRKATLRDLLEERKHKWRSIATLARSVGASEERTRELLVSIGARASVGSEPEVWGLISRVGVAGVQHAQPTVEE
jgi:hypothetical protein